MSIHDGFLELAASAIDFDLEADERAELERHLAGCDACRRTAAAFREDAAAIAYGTGPRLGPARSVEILATALRPPKSGPPLRLLADRRSGGGPRRGRCCCGHVVLQPAGGARRGPAESERLTGGGTLDLADRATELAGRADARRDRPPGRAADRGRATNPQFSGRRWNGGPDGTGCRRLTLRFNSGAGRRGRRAPGRNRAAAFWLANSPAGGGGMRPVAPGPRWLGQGRLHGGDELCQSERHDPARLRSRYTWSTNRWLARRHRPRLHGADDR